MFTPTMVKSIRVADPNAHEAAYLGLVGWRLVDVTYDPHERNWVMTFTFDLSQL
ncbi:MAG: hypothetical protein RIR49_920 [Actinomycetota bacterium]|jgi:hypothetical protein